MYIPTSMKMIFTDDNIMSSFENTSVNCKSKNKSTSKQSFLSKKIFGKKKYNRLDND